MSGVEAANAAGKINQTVAVHIFDDGPFGLGNEDGRGMIRRLYHGSVTALHELPRAWSRNWSAELNC